MTLHTLQLQCIEVYPTVRYSRVLVTPVTSQQAASELKQCEELTVAVMSSRAAASVCISIMINATPWSYPEHLLQLSRASPSFE